MTETNSTAYLTVANVAAELAVSEKHIRRLMKSGKLSYFLFGGAVRISRDDMEKYVAACRINKQSG